MKIIDAHMHFSRMKVYKEMAHEIKTPSTLLEMEAWMAKNNVAFGIAMGIGDFQQKTALERPMLPDLDKTWEISSGPYSPRIACCPGIDPYQILKYGAQYLNQLEAMLPLPYIVGIKIYLGYYPFYAYDDVYLPIYHLACQYALPIIFHSGDLSVSNGQLAYAHPLSIDRVATSYPDITFVIAHMGTPWLFDAASVILKNKNVFADLSGLIVGRYCKVEALHLQAGYFSYLKSALDYLYSYDKLMFATDWPFAPVQTYSDLLQAVIPAEYHKQVFYENATNIYSKIKKYLY